MVLLGIPHDNHFMMDDFFQSIFQGMSGSPIEIRSLRCHGIDMTRQSVTKKGLSPFFTKMSVQSDSITCKPLSDKNGKLI